MKAPCRDPWDDSLNEAADSQTLIGSGSEAIGLNERHLPKGKVGAMRGSTQSPSWQVQPEPSIPCPAKIFGCVISYLEGFY